jgi:DNA mismatch repair protein MutS
LGLFGRAPVAAVAAQAAPLAQAEVLAALRTASIDRMTPLDALNLLAKLKKTLG